MTSSSFKSPLLKALILSSAMIVTGAMSQANAQRFQPKAEEDWITYKNERFGYQLYYPAAIFTPQASDDGASGSADAADDAPAGDTANAEAAANVAPVTGGNTAQANPVPAPAPNAQAGSDDDEDDGDDEEDEEDDESDDAGDGADDDTDDTDDAEDGDDEGDDEEEEEEEENGENGDTAGSKASDASTVALLSKDGKSRIVTFAALNEDGISPDEYRKTLLDEFGGYDKLDYQPTGKSWFVLSGFRDDSIYYQKVMFTCSNRVVNVYSINFPTAEKPRYERLVEIMEDNFKTGRGTDTPANC